METAYLIELPQRVRNDGVFFWGTEDGEPNWTADHQNAKRFETREAAERHASDIGLPDFEVCEHAWQ